MVLYIATTISTSAWWFSSAIENTSSWLIWGDRPSEYQVSSLTKNGTDETKMTWKLQPCFTDKATVSWGSQEWEFCAEQRWFHIYNASLKKRKKNTVYPFVLASSPFICQAKKCRMLTEEKKQNTNCFDYKSVVEIKLNIKLNCNRQKLMVKCVTNKFCTLYILLFYLFVWFAEDIISYLVIISDG